MMHEALDSQHAINNSPGLNLDCVSLSIRGCCSKIDIVMEGSERLDLRLVRLAGLQSPETQ